MPVGFIIGVTPFLIVMPGSIAQLGGEGERRITCAWDGGPTLDFVCGRSMKWSKQGSPAGLGVYIFFFFFFLTYLTYLP